MQFYFLRYLVGVTSYGIGCGSNHEKNNNIYYIIKNQKSCLIQFFIFQLILEFILVRVVFKTGFLQWLTINKPNISSIKIILLSLKSKYNKNEINFREIFIAYLQFHINIFHKYLNDFSYPGKKKPRL